MNQMNTQALHPIFNNSEFFIPTPMMDDLATQVLRWIRNGDTGGLILGCNRVGKSRAIRYLMNMFTNRLGDQIPAVYISTPRRDTNTVAAVYKNLCFSLGLVTKSRPTADEMSNLVYHRLADRAYKSSSKQLILFVDEFQRLSLFQLEVFAEIYDRLNMVGVNICIIFVGNKQAAEDLIENSKRAPNELVRGRFFIQKANYYGIRNKGELKGCLKQYDLQTFPDVDGQSYTRTFVNNEGFQLSNTSSIFWDVYNRQYREQLNLNSWPMQYFTSAVRIFLVDYATRYGVEDDVLPELVERSIEASGLVKGLIAQ
jgi:hypothetical protein